MKALLSILKRDSLNTAASLLNLDRLQPEILVRAIQMHQNLQLKSLLLLTNIQNLSRKMSRKEDKIRWINFLITLKNNSSSKNKSKPKVFRNNIKICKSCIKIWKVSWERKNMNFHVQPLKRKICKD